MDINSISTRIAQRYTAPTRPKPSINVKSHPLYTRLSNELQRFQIYSSQPLQDIARSEIPISTFHENVHSKKTSSSDVFELAILKELLAWFKKDYFTWMNKPHCCGAETISQGNGTPTADEAKWGAGRVELYRCQICRKDVRFPRYSNPQKLMQTRTGRCGEWANVFTLFCRVICLPTRYVLDFTDHVWTEVYIGKWIHVDCCEGILDQPLLYEAGWNKKLSFVFSFGDDGVTDSIQRYSSMGVNVYRERRKIVDEATLRNIIKLINEEKISSLSSSEKERIHKELIKEKKELDSLLIDRLVSALNNENNKPKLSGRISGSLEWRTSRKETSTNDCHVKNLLYSYTPTDPLHLNHHAKKLNTSSILLTENKPNQVSSIYLSTPTFIYTHPAFLINNTPITSFILEFKFRISQSGADGFAVLFQSSGPSAIGTGGCGIGYDGINNCVAIEFDTYQSVDHCDDPVTPHISVHTSKQGKKVSSHHRASVACTTAVPGLVGVDFLVRVKAGQGGLVVYLTEVGGEFVKILEAGNVEWDEVLADGNFFVGFSGATGGLCQEIRVGEIKVYSC